MKKKYLIGLLTLLLCFTLIGCTKKEEKDPNDKTNPDTAYDEKKFVTDDKTLVYKESDSYLIFEHEGDKITASRTYIDYKSPEQAKIFYDQEKDKKYDTVKSFTVDGRYIIYEWAESEYKDYTLDQIKKLYKDLEIVEKVEN